MEGLSDFFGYENDSRSKFIDLEGRAKFGYLFKHPVQLQPLAEDNVDPGTAPTKLSEEEREDRQRSNEALHKLKKPTHTEVTSLKEFVNSRALPCLLALHGVSKRCSSGKGYVRLRTYPHEIGVWENHLECIEAYEDDMEGDFTARTDPYYACWSKTRKSSQKSKDEDDEKTHLISEILSPLFKCCLNKGFGQSDKTITSTENGPVIACIEFKSTQNLPLPQSATDIKNLYNKGKEQPATEHGNEAEGGNSGTADNGSGAGNSSGDISSSGEGSKPMKRTDYARIRTFRKKKYWEKYLKHYPMIFEDEDWRIVYPLGQLVEQIRVNNCAYGALTSGTRTYFVRVKLADGKFNLEISRRWVVGEPKYILAWYAMKRMAEDNRDEFLREKGMITIRDGLWGETDEPNFHRIRITKKEENEDSTGSPDSKKQKTDENTKNAPICPWEMQNNLGIQEVELESIQIQWDTFVGYGRNGPVRKAEWNGNDVALKQFYVAEAGERYQHEIEAYAALKELQGKVVPRLLFVSRSWCGTMRYIGTELGDAVDVDGDREKEKEVETEVRMVHKQLKEAGWTQAFEEQRLNNHVRIDGRVMVIDLEELEKTGKWPSRGT